MRSAWLSSDFRDSISRTPHILRVSSQVLFKIIFLFLKQNICCGFSKEPSQSDGSFEHPKHLIGHLIRHPKHMSELIGNDIITILCTKSLLICTYLNSTKAVWPYHPYCLVTLPDSVSVSVSSSVSLQVLSPFSVSESPGKINSILEIQ